MIEIQIKYETSSLLSKKNLIKRTAKQVLTQKGIKDTELSILITIDKRIKILNKKYRNINKPTDVLSFSQRDCPSFSEGKRGLSLTVPVILGDIIISADTLKKQAKIYGKTVDEELRLLVTHGIRHLLGYHHEHRDRK